MVAPMSDADVVIVGSGATGSLLAAHLGTSGRRVIVLESGPARRLDQLVSSTIWSRRLKWGGAPVRTEGANPVVPSFEAGWGTGGSALHHYACWFRLHPEDFEMASRYGKGLDWPLAYDELRPFYDSVQREVGLSGDAKLEVWRPRGAPYPMPPQPVFAQGEIIARGFAKLGERVAPLPMAINSVAYDGRPPCIQDGWCDAGCPTGALANPIAVYGPAMRKAGVQLINDATVTRVLTDATGRRVAGVDYVDAQGTMRTVRASVVILAAFAVQNPRILLNSGNARHPKGLANSSGLVGRYFTSHGAVNLYGLFPERTDNHMGRSGGQLVSQDHYAKDPKRGYLSGYTWRIGNALKLADLAGIANSRGDLFGAALNEFMKRAAQHLATMSALVENLPSLENRIELSADKDSHGLPLARVVHSLGEDARKCLEAATEAGRKIFTAAGATEVWAASLRTEHLTGGTIMGSDPAKSVTDGYGQTHDVANLFIAGPGLFPTSGAVNPTFTAAALAARTAQYIAREVRT
jgi:choline dehydrogenase-like flavoprotein